MSTLYLSIVVIMVALNPFLKFINFFLYKYFFILKLLIYKILKFTNQIEKNHQKNYL